MNQIVIEIKCMLYFVLIGCTTSYNKIASDHDRSVDYSKYIIFAWLREIADAANLTYNNAIIRNNILNYFGLWMSDRRYSVEIEQADLLRKLEIRSDKKEKTVALYQYTYYYNPYYLGNSYYSLYPYKYYYWHYLTYEYGHVSYPNSIATEMAEYVNGTISLYYMDRRGNKLIWIRTYNCDIYEPYNVNYGLLPAIHKDLNKYPVIHFIKKNYKLK